MRLHQLSRVTASSPGAPLQRSVDRLRALRHEADPRVRSFFVDDAAVYIARAPGRLDVMGGIADYSGATVLQLPLDCATVAMVQRQPDCRCDIATSREGAWVHFSIDVNSLIDGDLDESESLARRFAHHGNDHWAAYVVGVVQRCLRRADPSARARGGFRILIESDVPEGKGVSSSAALEVASMAAVASSLDIEVTAERLAADCQWVENHIVGAPCGIMDQMTSACGRRDQLMRLRCQPGTIEGHVDIPSGFTFFGIDSGLRHAVTGADYGTVRTAAFMGYRMIAAEAGLRVEGYDERVRVDDPRWHGYLANVRPSEFTDRFESRLPATLAGADFLDTFGGITDLVTRVQRDRSYPVRQATAHPIFEQQRVEQFATLLGDVGRNGSAARDMGRLMYASHASYGACGLGSSGTDRLVELVANAGPARGLFGAKITGGGSGGTVAILGRHDAEEEVRDIALRYATEAGRAAQVFAASGPGADETGVLVIHPER